MKVSTFYSVFQVKDRFSDPSTGSQLKYYLSTILPEDIPEKGVCYRLSTVRNLFVLAAAMYAGEKDRFDREVPTAWGLIMDEEAFSELGRDVNSLIRLLEERGPDILDLSLEDVMSHLKRMRSPMVDDTSLSLLARRILNHSFLAKLIDSVIESEKVRIAPHENYGETLTAIYTFLPISIAKRRTMATYSSYDGEDNILILPLDKASGTRADPNRGSIKPEPKRKSSTLIARELADPWPGFGLRDLYRLLMGYLDGVLEGRAGSIFSYSKELEKMRETVRRAEILEDRIGEVRKHVRRSRRLPFR